MTAIDPRSVRPGGESVLLGVLTLVTAVLGGALLQRGLTTWLEAVSFVTGAMHGRFAYQLGAKSTPILMLRRGGERRTLAAIDAVEKLVHQPLGALILTRPIGKRTRSTRFKNSLSDHRSTRSAHWR